MKTITQIPVKLLKGGKLTKGSKYAAAYDIHVPADYELREQRQIVPAAFSVELPCGWKANIRPRSGFSAKGMEAEVRTRYRKYTGEEYISTEKTRIDADVLIGLVDSDYRDEVGVIVKVYSLDVVAKQQHEFDVILENHVYLTKGTRFAQMEICGGEHEIVYVDELNTDIDRGGGFGHTGTK